MNQVVLNTDYKPIVYELSNQSSFHTLDMPPSVIRSIRIGDNVNAYGKIIINYEGINQTNYLHFKGGKTHILEPPVMFLSFHIDKIK